MKLLFILVLVSLTMNSCQKLPVETSNNQKPDSSDLPKENKVNSRSLVLDSIVVPKTFNFETHQLVDFEIHNNQKASFIIYALDPKREDSELVAKFSSNKGVYSLSKRVNKNVKDFLIIRSSFSGTTYRYESSITNKMFVYY